MELVDGNPDAGPGVDWELEEALKLNGRLVEDPEVVGNPETLAGIVAEPAVVTEESETSVGELGVDVGPGLTVVAGADANPLVVPGLDVLVTESEAWVDGVIRAEVVEGASVVAKEPVFNVL